MDEVRDLFETNVFDVMSVTQEFLKLLITSEGLIVNIGKFHILALLFFKTTSLSLGRVVLGSVAGAVPVSFNSIYAATKGALHSFANTLRQEISPFK